MKTHWENIGFLASTDRALQYAQERFGSTWTGNLRRRGSHYLVELK